MDGTPARTTASTSARLVSSDGGVVARRHASAAVPERSAHSLASAAVLGAARSMRRAASGHVAVTMAFAPGGPNARTPRRSVAASVAASCVVAAANRASDVIADDAGDAHRSVASATRAAAPRIGRSSSRLESSSPDASAYISRSSVAKTPAAPPRRFTSSLCESTARTFASSTFGVARATAGSGATGTGKRSRARSASGRYTLSARSRSRGTPACAAAISAVGAKTTYTTNLATRSRTVCRG